jgi:hypothetical protein
MALAEAALASTPSALFMWRAHASSYRHSVHTNASVAHKATPIYTGFFFKKMLLLSQCLQRRTFLSQQTKMTRSLLQATLQLILNTLSPAVPYQRLRYSLILQTHITSALGTAPMWYPLPRVVLNAPRKVIRFVFFYFSTFMYSPHQSMQHTNTLRQQWIFLPAPALFMLFLSCVNLETTELPVQKILLL